MKRIILILSIIISIWGVWWLVSLNFLTFSFGWQDAIFYLVLVSIDYLFIKWIGSSLNKKFNKIVDSFIKGENSEIKLDKGLLATYGLLLISMLPFLIFLLLFSLFVAIAFSLYGFDLILNAPRIPVALILALLAIPLGTLLGVVIGIVKIIFPSRTDPFGIEAKKEENKKLWALVDDISFFLQTRTVDKIILTPEPGVGVYLKGNNIAAIQGKGFRTLQIGLSSIDELTISQLKAILAHEYGHFSNKDTQWSAFTYAMGQGLTQALASTPGPSSFNGNEKQGIFSGVVSLNPAWWILNFYTKLYFSITGGFQRIKEVRADIKAVELTGGNAFAEGLKRVSFNDYIFSEYIQKHLVWDMLKENKVITNFSRLLRHAESNLKPEALNSLRKASLETGEVSEWDSHPATKTRIEYALRFKSIVKENNQPATNLFDNWDRINEKTAELYNQRLIAYVQAYAAAQKASQESEKNKKS